MSFSRSRQLFGIISQATLRQRTTPTPPRLPQRFFSSAPSRLSPRFFTQQSRPKMSLDPLTFSPSTLRQLIFRRPYGSYNYLPYSYRSTRLALWTIIGLNAAVFATWTYTKSTRNLALSQSLHEKTTLSWTNIRAGRYYTTITSAFTHDELWHFAFNMLAMHSFGTALMYAGGMGIGAPALIGLTLGGAVASSTAFLYQHRPAAEQAKRGWGRNVQSAHWARGASGVVMGFAAAASCIMPFASMRFPFVRAQIPMWVMMIGYVSYDYFFLSFNDGIGHSAHLGGAAFGFLYYWTNLRKFGGLVDLLRRGGRRW